ncbi:MAG: hypothetical protein GF418_11785 [Chitinivibrionales bacterium]|nr:hypothetical protein [Chitinivibrionales bacterium]MBD3396297.1 hypothetical protein [Chitinivibrionales bacterium]
MKLCRRHKELLMIAASLLCPARAPGAQPAVKTSAGIEWELGTFVNSSNARDGDVIDTTWLDGYWFQTISSVFHVDAVMNDRLSAELEYFGSILFTLPKEQADPSRDNQQRTGVGEMRSAHARLKLGNPSSPAATAWLGYFPFNYAPENRNLGEYLFKTGTYPGFIVSDDDDARLLGLRIQTSLPDMLTHDFIANVELNQRPQGDLSLTYLMRIGMGRPLEIAAGVMGHRLLRSGQAQAATLNYSNVGDRFPVLERVWNDSLSDWEYINTGEYYQKAGTKLLGRVVFDPKQFFLPERLGPQDLKLYAEGAVLGVKNYGGYYDNILERIPAMVGFNIPTFKLLDVLALEAEYYASPWKNSPYDDGRPVPNQSFELNPSKTSYRRILHPAEGAGDKAARDNLKWSLYAAKTIKERLTISARVASDHLRPGREAEVEIGPSERLHGPREFYVLLGIATRF